MDLAPGYEKHIKRSNLIGENLLGKNSALEISNAFINRLFEVEKFGFKHLVALGPQHDDHFSHYLGYQEDQAMIHGEKFDKKPLNRIFKAKYSFIKSEILSHDFKGEVFDLVMCGYTMNYLSFEEHATFIDKLSKLQVSGGLLEIDLFSKEHATSKHLEFYTLIQPNVLKSKYGESKLYLVNDQDTKELFSKYGYKVLNEESNKGVHHYLLRKI